ncbi:alkylhalidase-like protein [Kitasatospora sp. NE20-6]|uniref:NAD(P)/FAD-dependent oxidoreductase n=1 Tax=Kitasatospora sp. NE20-6 TaxID=2859066 RepID=UPI0034DBD5F3
MAARPVTMQAARPAARPSGHRGGARDHVDVLVVGGGPAGAAAALTLARAGRSVLLADAGTGPPKIGEALPSAARVLLHDLGTGDRPVRDGHLPCYANLSAWGSPALHRLDFIRDPNGPGWHLDRHRFDRALREEAAAAGAHLALHTAVRRAARRPDGGWTVTLQATRPEPGHLPEPAPTPTPAPAPAPAPERTVRCTWLVDAGGRRRTVAARAADHHRTDRLVASCLELPPTGDGRAGDRSSLVEAAEDGWWYTALLPRGRRLVAYFTDADLGPPAPRDTAALARLLARTEHVAALAAAHPLPATARPRRAPAHSVHLDRPTGDGWIAVGDAATAFDPISSQGILTALYTGMAGARALDRHLDGDTDADDGALAAYRTNAAGLLAAYRHNHHAVYALERRWQDRPFWARRHRAAVPGPAPVPPSELRRTPA